LIERFYDIEEGKILLSGRDIKDYSLEELRNSIAIAFQSPRLFTGTVKENLLWGKEDASQEEIEEACKIACCYDFILHSLKDGFDTQISQSGSNVSGGQRQRLCIARAILRKPKILILDDSFSALDRITEAQLKKNLREQLPNTTKIIISQKVSTMEDADKIIVLKDGKVNNIGTSEYLLENDDIYQDIHKVQMEGLQ
jgi:ATP-binding cassette subfamily B protein